MIWITITLAAIIGLLRGVKEGMVMITYKDPMHRGAAYDWNVRGHRWFGWYHAIGLAKDVLLMVFGVALLIEPRALILCALVVWMCYEIAYPITRWRSPISDEDEHIIFVGPLSAHASRIVMHTIRFTLVALAAVFMP